MKKISVRILTMLLMIGGAIVALPRPTAIATSKPAGSGTARIIVQRTPNFGTDLVIQLSIDGHKVADIGRSQHYGGTIAAGAHTITALALPNAEQRRPTTLRLIVRPGGIYLYTAAWEQDRLVLQPSTSYIPSSATAPLR